MTPIVIITEKPRTLSPYQFDAAGFNGNNNDFGLHLRNAKALHIYNFKDTCNMLNTFMTGTLHKGCLKGVFLYLSC